MDPRMLVVTLLSVLPALEAAITVYMHLLGSSGLMRLNSWGDDKSLVTEEDLRKFKLDKTQMLAIAGNFVGEIPDQVFAFDRGFSNRNEGDALEKHVEPVEVTTLDWQSFPVTLASREIVNNGTTEATFKANLSKTVYNKMSTSWRDAGGFSIRTPIRYYVRVSGTNIKMDHKGAWNESFVRNWPKKLVPAFGDTVRLQPGERTNATLTALLNEAVIEVEMEVEIDGDLVCQYNKYSAFGGRSMDISVKDAMEQSNMQYKLLCTVTVSLQFYSEPNIVFENI